MSTDKSTLKKSITVDDKTYYLPTVDSQLYKDKPVLKSPTNGDWYIYYNVWDFTTGKWKPEKDYTKVLNKKELRENPKQRKVVGDGITAKHYQLLKEGINPKTNSSISPFLEKSIEDVIAEAQDTSPVPTVTECVRLWKLKKAGKDNPNKVAPENKENTANTYKYFFDSFLAHCTAHKLENVKLHRVEKHFVYHWFEDKYTNGVWSDLTYNNHLGYLKAMFNHFAKVYDFISPINNLEDKEILEDSERFEPFEYEHVKTILNYLDNPQIVDYGKYTREAPADKFLALVCRTIYYSFLRISEISRLKIKNIRDYKEGYIELNTGITKNKKKLFNKLYIDPCLVAEFEKLGWEKYFKDKKYENYYVFTPDLIPKTRKTNGYQFGIKFARVLDKLTKSKTLKLAEEKKKYSLYSLKASGNIEAYKTSGWNILQISLQNRHSSITQTETYLRKLKLEIANQERPLRQVV